MATSEHFSDRELRCRHCYENLVDDGFLHFLETLRSRVGIPLVVSSGYRCPVHNAAVSTTGAHGPHTTGKAVDILIAGEDAFRLIRFALALQATGIGVKQKGPVGSRFIHLDILTEQEGFPRPRFWSY